MGNQNNNFLGRCELIHRKATSIRSSKDARTLTILPEGCIALIFPGTIRCFTDDNNANGSRLS